MDFFGSLLNNLFPNNSAGSGQMSAKAADSIFASEEKYRKLFDLSLDAIILSDLGGEIQTANMQAALIFGYAKPAELIRKNSLDLIAPEEKVKAKKQLSELQSQDKFSNLEYTALRRDGSRFFMEINAAVLRGRDGKPQGLIGIVRDMTHVKQMQENRSFIASIVESADDAIIGKDMDGLITSWNKGAERLFGYKADEVVGQSISIIYPPEIKAELPKILTRLREGEFIHHLHTVRMDRYGNRIPVSQTISPVVDGKGNVIGVSSILRDITKEKELDRLKDEFISLTSHALRTPLSAIKGLISMIYQGDYGPMNKNLEKPIANISISTERLIQLVNDLLNISRVKTGKLEFVLTRFSLIKSIEKVTKQLEPLVKQNNLELKFTQQNVSDVQADTAKTDDILNNLLSNALKFTNKGSIEISLKEDKELVIVSVKDTGIGISEKDKDKLFQRFQQIANMTTKQITGTGLGLYLSKMLANKMGGDVWLIESELKKGSTFAFSLPKFDSVRARKSKEDLILNHNNRTA